MPLDITDLPLQEPRQVHLCMRAGRESMRSPVSVLCISDALLDRRSWLRGRQQPVSFVSLPCRSRAIRRWRLQKLDTLADPLRATAPELRKQNSEILLPGLQHFGRAHVSGPKARCVEEVSAGHREACFAWLTARSSLQLSCSAEPALCTLYTTCNHTPSTCLRGFCSLQLLNHATSQHLRVSTFTFGTGTIRNLKPCSLQPLEVCEPDFERFCRNTLSLTPEPLGKHPKPDRPVQRSDQPITEILLKYAWSCCLCIAQVLSSFLLLPHRLASCCMYRLSAVAVAVFKIVCGSRELARVLQAASRQRAMSLRCGRVSTTERWKKQYWQHVAVQEGHRASR